MSRVEFRRAAASQLNLAGALFASLSGQIIKESGSRLADVSARGIAPPRAESLDIPPEEK